MWAWLIWFIWACVILCIFICSMAESQSSSSEGSSWRVLRNCLAVRPVRQALEEIWSIQIMEAQCDNSKNQQLSLRGRHFRRAEPLGLNQRGAININSRQLYNHIVLPIVDQSVWFSLGCTPRLETALSRTWAKPLLPQVIPDWVHEDNMETMRKTMWR